MLAVLSSLPSIFSGLLEDSLFQRYFSRFRVSAQGPRGLLEDSLFQRYFSRFRVSVQRSSRTLYFSGTFPASEYLFSAPRGPFILAVLFPLPSICSALLEDSLFQPYFSRFRVSVQLLEDSLFIYLFCLFSIYLTLTN